MDLTCDTCKYEDVDGLQTPCYGCLPSEGTNRWEPKPDTITIPREWFRETLHEAHYQGGKAMEAGIHIGDQTSYEYADRILAELDKEAQGE